MADKPAIGAKQSGTVLTDAKRLKQETRREKQAARKKKEQGDEEDDVSTRLCILDKVAVRRGKDSFEIVVDSPKGRKVIGMPTKEVEQVLGDLEIAIKVIRAWQ